MAQRRLQLRSEGKTSWHHCTSTASGHGQPAPGGEWHSQKPPNQERDLKGANPFTLRVKGLAPHRTSRGPSKVPPQCPRPLPHVPGLNRGPPAPLSWSQHAPDSPLSRGTSGPYHLYRCAGKKGQPRVQAGTKTGVQVLGVVQRPRARLRTSEEPPEGPPPHPKRPSCHYRKTILYTHTSIY